MSISVESLSKVYGSQKAVDGISFSAKPGVLGFLGPNGAGKSTTMKILTGYIPQTSGKATVCGFDVETQSLEVKRRIGYLPESNPLYQDMYVRESLAFIAHIHQVPDAEKRIEEIIELTGLTPEKHKKVGQLSKGYRQRVGLAQAILHDPEVLILDEPTSGARPQPTDRHPPVDPRPGQNQDCGTKHPYHAGSRSRLRSCSDHQQRSYCSQ